MVQEVPVHQQRTRPHTGLGTVLQCVQTNIKATSTGEDGGRGPDMNTLVWWCPDMNTLVWGCPDMNTLVWWCPDMNTLVWECPDMNTLVWWCPDMNTLAIFANSSLPWSCSMCLPSCWPARTLSWLYLGPMNQTRTL